MGKKKSLTNVGATSDCCEPCRESKKTLKVRLKEAEKKLESGSELLESIGMNYEQKLQAIGALYMDVFHIKRQLEYYAKT